MKITTHPFAGMPFNPAAGGAGGAPMQQQDERFRATWLDANMVIPPMMFAPGCGPVSWRERAVVVDPCSKEETCEKLLKKF